MRHIIIVDRVHPFLSEALSEKGFCCETDMTYTYDSFLSAPDQFEGLVIRSRFRIDARLLDSKPSLRFIVRIGSGVENIDVSYARQCGVEVLSTPEGNANAVAEHCLGLLMAALRHLASADKEVRAGAWLREKNKGTEIASHTYGLIGYGHTGPAFAQVLKALGAQVYAYDRFHPIPEQAVATPATLEDICQCCDVISLHVNYIEENAYFINDTFIQQVSQPFILLNTSRGLVVDTAAVVRNLQAGKILFAGLDVLEYESTQLKNLPKEVWPEAMELLSRMDNVILTPHVGGQTLESERRHAEFAFRKIQQFYEA